MNIVFILAFVGILIALAMAGRALLNDGRDGKPKTNRMVKALAWRVGLSVSLFLFILLSYKMGWIQPTGLPVTTR
ncbi:MAG: twin transmembrane helix small protein [Rubrivivax sp.]|nr:MAG: twin transmembrane helix small protein [Rubrivivax sp.]